MPHGTAWASSNNTSSTSQPQHYVAPSDTATIDNVHSAGTCSCVAEDHSSLGQYRRRQSQLSKLAKYAMTANGHQTDHRRWSNEYDVVPDDKQVDKLRNELDRTLSQHRTTADDNVLHAPFRTQSDNFDAPAAPGDIKRPPRVRSSLGAALHASIPELRGATMAMNDTPATTAPSSPNLNGMSYGNDVTKPPTPIRQMSGTSTPRVRPTTLDIPGLTKSKVSPDGRIASRDVGSKLVIVMVGLPARGKSYITKKLARYLNWLQHDTKIFNVGERRRVVAGGPNSLEKTKSQQIRDEREESRRLSHLPGIGGNQAERQHSVAQIILNGDTHLQPPSTPPHSTPTTEAPASDLSAKHAGDELEEDDFQQRPDADRKQSLATIVLAKDAPEISEKKKQEEDESLEQNSSFFDPQNKKAAQIREQVARETLDELLDYILYGNGSVGILDATNSTMARRKMIMDRIRERAGPQLNVLFLESSCVDQDLLEANMRLKLNGPDYREMDPQIALADFKKRVYEYEKAYVPLGEYEEKNNMPYIQMIDVGRKVISHQIKGFLMAQANYYLLNFNLAPRQIWITRHGLSMDNVSGKIGGDSDLAPEGQQYAKSLTRFMEYQRREWDIKQIEALRNTHFPPQPGDSTPPNPYYNPQLPGSDEGASIMTDATDLGYEPKAFCVWTSMLKRSIQTAQYFNEEEYDTKQMRMLDELNAGVMEGLTYNCISTQYPEEYRSRKQDKLHYRYPGPGGEGYLDITNRLRPVIVELERMTDHVLLVGHRSVARVLLAYFRGLKREEVADLDVPLGMLYCLEPKPYGVDFRVYKWDKASEWFYEVPDFKLKRAEDDMM
ncbi:putative 6-phosphofructo-2-kinase [Fulvia fulva]|uniref:6-phosphofructo-2-kinase n=1 Tax=Passalora fulva TaxID=5499 RepID=A0A9Q8P586_PASFU|nr:putative 6-phosphofructo-2-kinase [Fulvia fulva]KAK4633892.1 putative 6-phosphofructo-2-kinase [Fulvia fulva]UJO13664.1 putative 6-phosphofructo-2-kinase [Fulvia fulva]WPV10721.1 putative 6-phosphofructo-2-kinase [Fulvia fulva]